MSDQETPDGRRMKESEIKAALRTLTEHRSDPAFRERLRSDFASGKLAEARKPSDRRLYPWSIRAGWFVTPLAAAAVLLLVVALNRGPAWTVLDATGSGQILIDGRSIPVSDVAELQRGLDPEAVITVPEGATLVLRSSGVMLFELAPGTRMTLPPPPGRWFADQVEGRVERGDLRILTGPQFPGRRLRVRTTEGITELTGTLVSVYKDADLTCVCVLEGTARVGADEASMADVPAGTLRAILAGESESVESEISSAHAHPLSAFAEKYRHAIEGEPREP